MSKYPIRLEDLSEKELANLNFTALLFLHAKIDRIEKFLEQQSKQSGHSYHALDNDPTWHLGDYFQKIDGLIDSLKANIESDIAEKKK
jgi:hypothetical protein